MPWSLPRTPSSWARAGPGARLRPAARLARAGCRREAVLLVRAVAVWRYRPLGNSAEDRRGFDCSAMTVGPGDTVAAITFDLGAPSGYMNIKKLQRPYAGPCARNSQSSVRRSSATPESAGAANRQRPCVSQSRRVASSDRAEEAGIRSRSPGPAHKRGDGSAREGPALSGPSLAGSTNGRWVLRCLPAERCDAAWAAAVR